MSLERSISTIVIDDDETQIDTICNDYYMDNLMAAEAGDYSDSESSAASSAGSKRGRVEYSKSANDSEAAGTIRSLEDEIIVLQRKHEVLQRRYNRMTSLSYNILYRFLQLHRHHCCGQDVFEDHTDMEWFRFSRGHAIDLADMIIADKMDAMINFYGGATIDVLDLSWHTEITPSLAKSAGSSNR